MDSNTYRYMSAVYRLFGLLSIVTVCLSCNTWTNSQVNHQRLSKSFQRTELMAAIIKTRNRRGMVDISTYNSN